MHRFPVDPSSFSTEVAAGSELLQAVGTAQTEATQSAGTATGAEATQSASPVPADPPMAGFSASVHLYLSQLTVTVYSKTTTLLAANMVLVSLLLSTRTSIKIGLDTFYIGAVFFFSISAMCSTIVLFPRQSHHKASQPDDTGGLIFWRAILADANPDKYHERVMSLNKAKVEEEYAKDNYHIAKTLRFKDTLLRAAISLFILGLTCAVIGVVTPILFAHR